MKEKIQLTLDIAVDMIYEKQIILEKIEDRPELILTKLYDSESNQPYYDLPFLSIKETKTGISHHDFQKYIANILIPYLSKYDNEVEIVLEKESQYPSRYTIRYNGYEVLRFDIYKHKFCNGVFESLESIIKYIQEINVEIRKIENEISDLEKAKKNPYLLAKTWKDRLFIPFNREKVNQFIDKKIENQIRIMKGFEDWKERSKERKVKLEINIDKINERREFWKKYFKEVGYKESENVFY